MRQDEEKFNFIDNINFYQRLHKIQLNGEQTDAVLASMNKGVSIITGGPGTGKTTIIKGMLKIFKNAVKEWYAKTPFYQIDNTFSTLISSRSIGLSIRIALLKGT